MVNALDAFQPKHKLGKAAVAEPLACVWNQNADLGTRHVLGQKTRLQGEPACH